jgi:hypothetical protein
MTADEPRLRVTTNLALGICLILLGTVLILDRMQLVPAAQLLRFWPLALVLFGVTLVIQSFQPDASARQDGAHAGHIFVLVILAVLTWNGAWDGLARTVTRTDSSETTNVVAVIGRHQQISSAPVFRAAHVTTIIGRAELDLRETTIAPGEEAVVDVFTVMGRSTVRVPDGWKVEIRATPIMGGARDRRGGTRDAEGAPRLVIRGFIMWGELDIRS